MIKMHENLMFKQLSLTTITNVLRIILICIFIFHNIFIIKFPFIIIPSHLLFVIKKIIGAISLHFFNLLQMYFPPCHFGKFESHYDFFFKCWTNINFVTISFFFTINMF